MVRVFSRAEGESLFNPIPVKRYKVGSTHTHVAHQSEGTFFKLFKSQEISFRSSANVAGVICDQYLEGKLAIRDVTRFLSMDFSALQREVYSMLPVQDRPDHEYLMSIKPKPLPSAASQFMSGNIGLEEYEYLVCPGKVRYRFNL